MRSVTRLCLSIILLSLAACAHKPDASLLNSIRQDVERFERQQQAFVEHLDQLETAKDTLSKRFMRRMPPQGREAFLADTPTVRLYYALLDEHAQNVILYKAFLDEYQKSLTELHTWADGLENTPEDDDAVREQWHRYVEQFEDDMATERSIQQSTKDWQDRFQSRLADFALRFNYLPEPAEPASAGRRR